MAIQVEHEIHTRRRGRNIGVGLLLLGFIAIVFGLTVVKVLQLGDLRSFETFDHVVRPQILPENLPETAPEAAPEGTN
ncbi:hypothetical protein SAMN05444339_106203 [Loktanella atrilutea]|uniref:Cytochrome C oxidase assembly protein n=1 Tax=Loktanella atrilutea TaxID=366533 RepID=A0A1M5BWJ3_LOKAT|nr:hypothetical protein [Loktanella atrilutea]SHF46786.1 hypothetical protein SAMN05444339_106203 [Loktanella atrilutea]